MPSDRTVHIVDDDAAVRRSLARLLDAAGFEPITYDSALAFLAAAPALTAGCALLDIRMPDMDGFEVQARLNDLKFRVPIIVITAQGDVPTAVRAMKAGAVDFIEKPYNDEVLITAVEAALARGSSRDRVRETEEAATRIAKLSRREHEVLDALMAGHANKTIAFDLGISVRTVEVHRARMMERLGTKQLAEAVRLAVLAKYA
jgi:two-component system, LuxR family, response regulator FixJ